MNLFDHLKSITQKPYDPEYWDNLSESDKKTFQPYMIHRFLSMNSDWVEIVNYVQDITYGLNSREIYKVYASIIPKSNRFLKYIKSSSEPKIPVEIITTFQKYFEISKKESVDYVNTLLAYDNGIDRIFDIVKLYGVDDKQIKKLSKQLKGI